MKKKTRKNHPSDGFTYRQHIKFIYSIRIQNDSFATVQQKKLVAVLQAESAALAMKRLAIHLKMMNRAKKYKANGNASTTTTTKKSLRISFQLKWFPICWYPIMLAGFMHFPSIDIRCMYFRLQLKQINGKPSLPNTEKKAFGCCCCSKCSFLFI